MARRGGRRLGATAKASEREGRKQKNEKTNKKMQWDYKRTASADRILSFWDMTNTPKQEIHKFRKPKEF